MIKRYKTAVYQFNPNVGLNEETITSIDNWLNMWLSKGYVVQNVSEITSNGLLCGFFYVFAVEDN